MVYFLHTSALFSSFAEESIFIAYPHGPEGVQTFFTQDFHWHLHLVTKESAECWHPPLQPSLVGELLRFLSWKQLDLNETKVVHLWVFDQIWTLQFFIQRWSNNALFMRVIDVLWYVSHFSTPWFQLILRYDFCISSFKYTIQVLVFIIEWLVFRKPFQKVLCSLLGYGLIIWHTHYSITQWQFQVVMIIF